MKSLQSFFWNIQVFFYVLWTFLDFQVLYYCCCQVWLESLILSFTFLSCFFYGPFAPDWILVSRKLQVNPILSDIGKIPIFDYFKRRSLKIDFSLSKGASRGISLKNPLKWWNFWIYNMMKFSNVMDGSINIRPESDFTLIYGKEKEREIWKLCNN